MIYYFIRLTIISSRYKNPFPFQCVSNVHPFQWVFDNKRSGETIMIEDWKEITLAEYNLGRSKLENVRS